MDPKVKACQQFMRSNPRHAVILSVSCFAYSLVGVGLMLTADFLPPSYFPFTEPWAYFCLGCSLFVQGPLSYLGDVHSVLTLGSDLTVYCSVDRLMATANAIFAFVAFAGVHTTLKLPQHQPHRISLAILATCWTIAVAVTFPMSKYTWGRGNMLSWWFWHNLWHFVPCGLTIVALIILSRHHDEWEVS